MSDYLLLCFSGPNLPASVLLLLAMFYWLLVIIAGLDFDFLDFDLDFDSEPDFASAVGYGVVMLRFMNIGRVPIAVWGSVFAVVYWLVSMLFTQLVDGTEQQLSFLVMAQYIVRNLAIGVILTKICTQPLRGKFDVIEPNAPEDLLGQQCVITTSTVSESFGQAEYKTEGAPLLLNVRTRGTPLAKGERVVFEEFDSENNVYLVRKLDPEV